ncbi:MAG: GAP family protein [Solirubrobacteraceae bacterium]
MLSLALAVIAIALPDSLNPSLIAAEVFLAAGPHPGRRTMSFALSAWTVTFLVGVALALGLGDFILSVVPKPGATTKYALFLAAGLLLLIGGIVIWVRRRALGTSGPTSDGEERSHGSPILLGAGIAGIELLTAFPYFAAIAMIVGSSASDPGKVWLLFLYCVVYTLPLFGIAIVCLVMGDRAEGALRPVLDWMFTRWPLLVGPLAAVIGIALLVYGILRLTAG